MLQALYFCKPFRERLIRYHDELPEGAEDNLLVSLGELFSSISAQKKRTGVYAPKRFIQRLKRDNELFRSFMHQDAHEFFNYTLNECCEILEKQERAANPDPPSERRQIKSIQSRLDVATSMQRCPEREILTHGQRGFRGIVVPHIVDVSAMGRRIVTAIDTTMANGTLCRNAKPSHQAQQTCFAAPVSSREQ